MAAGLPREGHVAVSKRVSLRGMVLCTGQWPFGTAELPVAQQLWSAAALPPLLYPLYVSLNPTCVLHSQPPTDTPLLSGVRK